MGNYAGRRNEAVAFQMTFLLILPASNQYLFAGTFPNYRLDSLSTYQFWIYSRQNWNNQKNRAENEALNIDFRRRGNCFSSSNQLRVFPLIKSVDYQDIRDFFFLLLFKSISRFDNSAIDFQYLTSRNEITPKKAGKKVDFHRRSTCKQQLRRCRTGIFPISLVEFCCISLQRRFYDARKNSNNK